MGLKSVYYVLFILIWRVDFLKSHNVPCDFNPMCLCWVQDDSDFTKMDINCLGVPFARFPDVSVSYIAQLDIVGSGIQILDNDALASSTSVEALGLMSSQLISIGEKSLHGVIDSLRSLDLSYNSIEEVPFKALLNLRKLNWLNLHSNHLTSLDGDWGMVKNTLASAFFGDNSIKEIPKCFADFEYLVWLNLDNNNLEKISEKSLPPNIHTISLNNNLLKSFPAGVRILKELSFLYLGGNEMKALELPYFQSPHLDLIDVSENSIEILKFMGYPNRTLFIKDFNLSNNKLQYLPADIFQYMEVKRIYLSSNGIHTIDESAFRGLEDTLEYLNLENNDINEVPDAIMHLRRLSYLYLSNNDIRVIKNDSFLEFSENLKALSLQTNHLTSVPFAALSRCSNLLHLNLGYNKISYVEPGSFDWAENLEILLLRNNIISKLKADTFKGAVKLKELSLSFNHLTELEDDAFLGIDETLEILELSFAFSTDVFPQRALRPLVNLMWLVLDNNNFHTIDPTAFYSLNLLRYVNLESNRLHYLPEMTFLSDVHPELRDIKLGYNFLETIPDVTFHNFTELRSIDLSGNRIRHVTANSVEDCPKLLTLSLAYNRISKIDRYSFCGLSSLRFLHLEFNRLTSLELDSIFESGDSEFSLNASYNSISTIHSNFLKENLTRLDLGFNNLTHLPTEVFKNTPNLKVLDMRNNFLTSLEAVDDTFGYV